MSVRSTKRLDYLVSLSSDPTDVREALKLAGLSPSLADDANVWDETMLVRREMIRALDAIGANSNYIAVKLKEQADRGNLRAIEAIAKLRGYYDVPSKASSRSGFSGLGSELARRDRIIEVLGLSHYPVQEAPPQLAEANPTGEGGERQAGQGEQNRSEAGSRREAAGEPQEESSAEEEHGEDI